VRLRDEHWDVKFRGVTIWPYLRFNYQEKRITAYKNNYRFKISALLLPVFLVIHSCLRKRPVVSVVARSGMVDYVQTEFASEHVLLVFRSEQLPGNALFVEAMWVLFRKLSWRFVRSEYDDVCRFLDSKGIESRKYESDIKTAIGDYFYNYFISFFVRGRVYYTNCLIPKIERYMGLMDSVEIQHGVIHEEHMDYANIESKYIKNSLLVWSSQWEERLKSIGYGGELIVANHDYISIDDRVERSGITIFTTVDEGYSCKVDAFKGSFPVRLQKHPRDYFSYTNNRFVEVVAGEKLTAYAICHDTTLIYYFLNNSVFFVYLLSPNEDEAVVVRRMNEKYGASFRENFLVSDSVEDALKKIRLHEQDQCRLS